MQDFHLGSQPRNVHEIYNHAHSSLRTTIERTFRVWKARWHILHNMPSYKFSDQVTIATTKMTLHNFIKRTSAEDFEFNDLFSDPNSIHLEDQSIGLQDDVDEEEESVNSKMDAVRDRICAQLLSNVETPCTYP